MKYYKYNSHDNFLIILSFIVAIILSLGIWGTYQQIKDERIKNAQQKTEYQENYSPSKQFGAQDCR